MSELVWLYDSVDLAKHGRHGTLSVLDTHPGVIVITKEVYSELADGEGFERWQFRRCKLKTASD